MRSKPEIFKQLLQTPKPFGSSQKGQVERTEILIEVLIDIRDILITDAKDAMNALIEIRTPTRNPYKP